MKNTARLTLAALSALALATLAPSRASASPQVDNNTGEWVHFFDDTVGISFEPAAIIYDGIGRLLTLNPAGTPPPTTGTVTTTLIEPSSFDAWGSVYLKYTSSTSSDVTAVFQAADGTNYPLTLATAATAPWTSRASIANVPRASVPGGRVIVTLTKNGPIAPTLQGLRVTWSPRSILALNFTGPATVNSSDTVTWRVATSVSLVNAQDLVAWVVLPTPNVPAAGSTTAPPAPPVSAETQDASLSFSSATDGGIYNGSGAPITVAGVSVPAGAVYWSLGEVAAGHTFALRFTARTKMGTLDQTFFEPVAHVHAANANPIDSPKVTTRVSSAPNPFIRKTASNVFLLFNEYRAYAGSEITYTLYGGNYEIYPGSHGEDYYQTCVYDDLTPLLNLAGNPAIKIPPGVTPGGGGQVYLAGDPTPPACGGVAVPPNSVWWYLDRLTVGERFNVSYAVTLREEAPTGTLNDGDIIASTAHLRSGFAPEQASSSFAIKIGVPDDPTGAFAKGDMIRGSASISPGNDNPYSTVTYGDPVGWLLRTVNNGISALDDIVMVDKIPALTTFDSAFLPAVASGTIYYNDCSTFTVPGDCLERAPNDPPDLDQGMLVGPSWTTTQPPKEQVVWVAFVVPRLASPYFPEPGVPTGVTGEIGVTVDLPDDYCPAIDPTLTNVGNFRVYRYTPPTGSTELIDGGGMSASNTEYVQVTKLTPDLSRLSISDNPDQVVGAKTVTYNIYVPNQKLAGSPTDTALNVVLNINIPQVAANGIPTPLGFQSISASGGAVNFVDSQTIRVTWPSILASSSKSVSLTLKVPSGVLDGVSFNLSATVTGNDDLCGPSTGSASESTRALVEPYLIVDKQVDLAVVGPGDAYDYRLSYVNIGDGASTGTWIVDRLPPEITFQSAQIPVGGQVWFSNALPPTLPGYLSQEFAFSDAVVRANFVQGSVGTDGRAYSPYGGNTTFVAFLIDDGSLSPAQLVTDQQRHVDFTVTVDAGTTTGTVIANDALIVANGLPQAISDKARDTVSEKPSIRVVKGGPEVVAAGEVFDITITYFNDSTNTDDHVVISELLPSELTILSFTHTWNSATPYATPLTMVPGTGGEVHWDLLDPAGTPLTLDPLQGGTFVVTVQVTPGTPTGTLLPTVTTATATKTIAGETLESTAYATLTPLVQNADLWVRVQPDQFDPPSGETVTYTVLLSNEGGHYAETVELTVDLPSTLTYVPGTAFVPSTGWSLAGQPTLIGGTLHFAVAYDSTIDGPSGPAYFPGHSGDVQVVFQTTVGITVAPATNIQVCATGTTTTGEDPDFDNIGCATVRTPLPDAWVKIAAPPLVQPGSAYQYTVTYGNNNRQAAPDAVLVVAMPDGPTLANGAVDLTFLNVTATGGQQVRYFNGPPQATPPVYTPTGGGWGTTPSPQTSYIAILAGTLPAQSGPYAVYLRVEARDPATGQTPEGGTRFQSCAGITIGSPQEGEGDPGNNSACALTRTPGIDVEVRKTCDPEGAYPGVRPGEAVTFTLELENTGTVPAYGIKLSEIVPAGITLLSDDATVVRLDDGSGQLVDPSESPIVGDVPWTREGDTFLLGTANANDLRYFRKIGLSPGATTRVTLTGRVNQDVQDDTSITNRARAEVFYRPDWPGAPVEEILDNNEASCSFAVFRPDPFVVKTVINRATGDDSAANAGDTLDYTLEYGNAGHATAEGVLLEDVMPEGVTFVAGSLTNLPAGAHVEYDSGDGSFGYIPNQPAGTPDPNVVAIRVVWDEELQAPASGVFSQTTAAEFDTGSYHQTYGDSGFEAVMITDPNTPTVATCQVSCDNGIIPKAASIGGNGSVLPDGAYCPVACPADDNATEWPDRYKGCLDTYAEAQAYVNCITLHGGDVSACTDLVPKDVWRSCWPAECPAIAPNTCEYNAFAGACAQSQGVAMEYYYSCVNTVTAGAGGEPSECAGLLPLNDCARCVGDSAEVNLTPDGRDWHLRSQCTKFDTRMVDQYEYYANLADRPEGRNEDRSYSLDVVGWDTCWGDQCPSSDVDSCEFQAWSDSCSTSYAEAMLTYRRCVNFLEPNQYSDAPALPQAPGDHVGSDQCAPLLPTNLCQSCLGDACGAAQGTSGFDRLAVCQEQNAKTLSAWRDCAQQFGWYVNPIAPYGPPPQGASVEAVCGPLPYTDCSVCAPSECSTASAGGAAWSLSVETCLNTQKNAFGYWYDCVNSLPNFADGAIDPSVCDNLKPHSCTACMAQNCPSGGSNDAWYSFQDYCYTAVNSDATYYEKCRQSIGANGTTTLCDSLAPSNPCAECAANSCPDDGSQSYTWWDLNDRCQAGGGEGNSGATEPLLRCLGYDDNSTADCDGMIPSRQCAACYERGCPSADADHYQWYDYGQACAIAMKTAANDYQYCVSVRGVDGCEAFVPHNECGTCWTQGCPDDPEAYPVYVEKCNEMAGGYMYNSALTFYRCVTAFPQANGACKEPVDAYRGCVGETNDYTQCDQLKAAALACTEANGAGTCNGLAPTYTCKQTFEECQPKGDFPPLTTGPQLSPSYVSPALPGSDEGNVTGWDRIVVHALLPPDVDPMTYTLIDAATGVAIPGFSGLVADENGIVDISSLSYTEWPYIKVRADFPSFNPSDTCKTLVTGAGITATVTNDMNDHGQVAGGAVGTNIDGTTPFYWSEADGMAFLPCDDNASIPLAPGLDDNVTYGYGMAYVINDQRQLFGQCDYSWTLWTPAADGTFTATATQANLDYPVFMNESAVVADAAGNLWHPDYGTFSTGGQITGLNDLNQAIGYDYNRAAAWTLEDNGTWSSHLLPLFNETEGVASDAYGINAIGTVSGSVSLNGQRDLGAAIWRFNGTDWDDPILLGTPDAIALQSNVDGVIVGVLFASGLGEGGYTSVAWIPNDVAASSYTMIELIPTILNQFALSSDVNASGAAISGIISNIGRLNALTMYYHQPNPNVPGVYRTYTLGQHGAFASGGRLMPPLGEDGHVLLPAQDRNGQNEGGGFYGIGDSYVWKLCDDIGKPRLEDWTVIYTTDKNPSVSFSAAVDDVCQTQVVNTAQISTETPQITFANDSSTATIPVKTADLTVSLAVDKVAAQSGDTLTYTVRWTNDGPALAKSTVVQLRWNDGQQERDRTWQLGNVAAGASGVLTQQSVIDLGGAPGELPLGAVATIDSPTIDCNAGNSSDTVLTVVKDVVNVYVDKAGPQATAIGEPFTYTLTYGNNGNVGATTVVVTDVLPAGLTFLEAVPAPTSDPAAGLEWVFHSLDENGTILPDDATLDDNSTSALAAGERRVITVTVMADSCDDVDTTVTNFATVSSSPLDAFNDDNEASADTRIAAPYGAIAATIEVSRATAEPGDALIYTVHYGNAGSASLSGASLTFTGPDGAPQQFALAALPAGEFGAVVIPATASGTVGQTLLASASLSADGACPISVDGPVVTLTGPGLHLVKSADRGAACGARGDRITWSLLVTNTGATDLTDVVVTDPSDGVTVVPGSISGVGANATDPTQLSWHIGTLPAGAALTLSYQTTPPAGASIIANVAAASAADGVRTTSPVAYVRSTCAAGATLVKSWTAGCVLPGSDVEVALTVRNTGLAPLSGLIVTDPLAPGLTYGASTTGGTLSGGVVTFTIPGSVPPGATRTLVYSATLGAGMSAGDLVIDRAQLSGGGLPRRASNQVAGAVLDCDDGSACTSDSCTPLAGCINANAPDETPCMPADLCATGGQCVAGLCTVTEYLDCDDDNACTDDSCAAGACQHANVSDGTECDDFTVCSLASECQSGACAATELVDCDDENVCTTDLCDAETGCYQENAEDGTTCDDDNACSDASECQGGTCFGTNYVSCSDGNDCTTDFCDPAVGCAAEPVENGMPCDDDDLCTFEDFCTDGACGGSDVTCGPPTDCQFPGVCNSATGVCDYELKDGEIPVPIQLTDLGTLGGATSRALAVNDSGVVVGASDTEGSASHAFAWTADGGMVDLTPNANQGVAVGVNAAGVVVGASVGATGAPSVFRWHAGTTDTLWNIGGALDADSNVFGPTASGKVAGNNAADQGAYAAMGGSVQLITGTGVVTVAGLNDGGTVAGSVGAAGSEHAFRWSAGSMTDLGTLGGGYAIATAINGAGTIVGYGQVADGSVRAFYADAGDTGLTELPPLCADDGTGTTVCGAEVHAIAIDDTGRVLGWALTPDGDSHAVLWAASGVITDLGTLAGGDTSTPVALTAGGGAVGDSTTAWGQTQAVYWNADLELVGLGTLGLAGSRAVAVDAAGHVAGELVLANGGTRAFLWDAGRGLADLGTLGGTSATVAAMNALGQVVGASAVANGDLHAYMSAEPATSCVFCESDDEAPVIVCPVFKGAVECVDGGATVTLGNPSVSDACGRPVQVGSDALPSYPVGATPVTYTATDSVGNEASCATTVVVKDTTAPTLLCPESSTVEADAGICGATVTMEPTATDTCDGADGLTIVGPTGPTLFAPGSTTVSYSAVDASGNIATCTTTLEVVGVEELSIACEPELTVEAPADFCGYPDAISANVVDVCAVNVTVTSAADNFPIGVTNVTFTADNDRGDHATCDTKLTVVDVTPPDVQCGIGSALPLLPTAIAPTVADACTAVVTISELRCVKVADDNTETTVEDGCDVAIEGGAVVVRSVPEGQTELRWTVTATDPSGNQNAVDCSTGLDDSLLDRDHDGVVDGGDNCPDIFNPDQLDTDLDGIGDVCDDTPADGLFANGGGGCAGGGDAAPLGLALLVLALLVYTRRRRLQL